MNNNIQDHLIESLKKNQNNYHLSNIIGANHPYPCGFCQKNVNRNQKAIECSKCKHWIHINAMVPVLRNIKK